MAATNQERTSYCTEGNINSLRLNDTEQNDTNKLEFKAFCCKGNTLANSCQPEDDNDYSNTLNVHYGHSRDSSNNNNVKQPCESTYDTVDKGEKGKVKQPCESTDVAVGQCEKGKAIVGKENVRLLQDLSARDTRKLKGMLDRNATGLKNWQHVAEKIFEDLEPKERNELIKEIDDSKYGGILMGERFLSVLQTSHPEVKIKKIKDRCSDESRNDVVIFFKSWDESACLWDVLLRDTRKQLASKLDLQDLWELLADDFEFSNERKDQIRTGTPSKDNSCTAALLRALKTQKPKTTVSELAEICSKLKMNDVANALNEFN